MKRLVTIILVSAIVAIGAFAGASWISGGEDDPPSPPPSTLATPIALVNLKIIFPEGFSVAEMANRVAAVRKIAIAKRKVTPRLTRAGYLRAVAAADPPLGFRKDAKPGTLEGFLFPALYEFTQESTAEELVSSQLATFRQRFAKVSLAYARSKNLTPYDILIIASMIEKETAVPSERKLVAAVIYNRLHNRMPLGIDATIRYGLGIPGTQSLTKKALASDSPYNTRLRKGLPPTPIANPGLASIQAAAHPAKVDYLYYVRRPKSKSHFFTADEHEFLRAVCDFGYACS
jgi:peptidoglycan lytic transglycosylase G